MVDQHQETEQAFPNMDLTLRFGDINIPLSRPLWLPEGVKNRMVSDFVSRCRTVFPGIDFPVENQDLRALGMQIFPSHDALDIDDLKKAATQPGNALCEAMTELCSWYIQYGGRMDEFRAISSTRQRFGGNVHEISYDLLTTIWSDQRNLQGNSKTSKSSPQVGWGEDALLPQVYNVIGRTLFTNNFSEIQEIYRRTKSFYSLEQLFQMPLYTETELEELAQATKNGNLMQRILFSFNRFGTYDTFAHRLIIGLASQAVARVLCPIWGIAGRVVTDKFDKATAELGFKAHSHAWFHEMTHFVTFTSWEKAKPRGELSK